MCDSIGVCKRGTISRLLLCFLLIASMCLGMLSFCCFEGPVEAFAASTPYLRDNGDGTRTLIYVDSREVMNELLEFDFTDKEYLVITGQHNASSARWHYYTCAYNFTAKTTNRCISKYKDRVVTIARATDGNDTISSSVQKSRYLIRWDDLLSAAEKLFDGRELAKGVTLYMSNVFQVLDRDKGDKQYGSDITDYDVMTNSSGKVRSLPAGLQWSDNTLRLLPAYYDIPISIARLKYSADVLKTNCMTCAENYIRNGMKEKGMTFCSEHKSKDVWFVLESNDSIRDEDRKYHKISENVTFVLEPECEQNGKCYEIDAECGTQKDSSGCVKVNKCKTKLFFYDSLEEAGAIDGKGIGFSDKADKASAYRFYRKSNGNFGLEITMKKACDVVAVVPYREKKKEPTITPTIPIEKREEGRSHESTRSLTFSQPQARGELVSEYYDTVSAIPSTEDLTANVFAKRYLLEAGFSEISGTKVYDIHVSLPYVITYKGPSYFEKNEETGEYEEKEGTDITVSGEVGGIIQVSRDYSFTQLNSLSYFAPAAAGIKNGCLEGGNVTMTANLSRLPLLSFYTYAPDEAGHIKDPEDVNSVITLPTYSVSTTSTDFPGLPSVSDSYAYLVEQAIGQIEARNDSLTFDGRQVLDGTYRTKNAAAPVYSAVKEPDTIAAGELSAKTSIPAETRNTTFPSNGTITYRCVAALNCGTVSEKSYRLEEVNDVRVHTPVVCEGMISADNRKYVQLHKPDEKAVPLVVGRDDSPYALGHENDSCDFFASVSNYGRHMEDEGYGERDYYINKRNEGGAYLKREAGLVLNQIRLPFDVNIDMGNNYNEADDVKLPADSWYTLGTGRQRFYIDESVCDGDYSAQFRTIAVNCRSDSPPAMEKSNTDGAFYAAMDSIPIQVSGKLHSFTMTGIDDELEWKDILMKVRSGTRDQLGIENGAEAFEVLPLVNGDNPVYRNRGALKTGYTWDFSFRTTGSSLNAEDACIELVPTFYHVDRDGRNRTEVDIYYNETIKDKRTRLVRVGSAKDLKNRKDIEGGAFSYGKIRLYGMKGDWHFSYRLPETIHVTKAGTDVMTKASVEGIDYLEPFWIRDGYLIISLKLTGIDSLGEEISSYANLPENLKKGYCSMWQMEASPTSKTDWYGRTFSFFSGDIILAMNGRSRKDDFVPENITR